MPSGIVDIIPSGVISHPKFDASFSSSSSLATLSFSSQEVLDHVEFVLSQQPLWFVSDLHVILARLGMSWKRQLKKDSIIYRTLTLLSSLRDRGVYEQAHFDHIELTLFRYFVDQKLSGDKSGIGGVESLLYDQKCADSLLDSLNNGYDLGYFTILASDSYDDLDQDALSWLSSLLQTCQETLISRASDLFLSTLEHVLISQKLSKAGLLHLLCPNDEKFPELLNTVMNYDIKRCGCVVIPESSTRVIDMKKHEKQGQQQEEEKQEETSNTLIPTDLFLSELDLEWLNLCSNLLDISELWKNNFHCQPLLTLLKSLREAEKINEQEQEVLEYLILLETKESDLLANTNNECDINTPILSAFIILEPKMRSKDAWHEFWTLIQNILQKYFEQLAAEEIIEKKGD